MNRHYLTTLLGGWLTSTAYAADAVDTTANVANATKTANALVVGSHVPSQAGNFMQVLLGLIAVLALMAVAAWLLRRFNVSKGLGGTNIRVIGGVSIGNRERVVVVEVADQWIVVGVAPGNVNALMTMPRQETIMDEAAAPTKSFSSWLAHTLEKRNEH